MSRERLLRVGWMVAVIIWVVVGLAYLVQFIWNWALHDTLGWMRIGWVDALGWALLLCLVFTFIYLLKEDVRG